MPFTLFTVKLAEAVAGMLATIQRMLAHLQRIVAVGDALDSAPPHAEAEVEGQAAAPNPADGKQLFAPIGGAALHPR